MTPPTHFVFAEQTIASRPSRLYVIIYFNSILHLVGGVMTPPYMGLRFNFVRAA